MYYFTEVDGCKKIYSELALESGQYLTIFDVIYNNDHALYKVKDVKNNKLSLGLIKILNLSIVENMEDYNPKQLYLYEDKYFFTEAKVNKNQTIFANGEFFVVVDLVKGEKGIRLLVLDKVDFVVTTNIYTIYRTHKKSGIIEEHLLIDNYKEAIITLSKLRSQNDEYYYRFI